MNFKEEASSSSADKVMESSLLANFKIFYKFSIESPKVNYLSHLKLSKPFSSRFKETKATWEESIA